jgi:hypothetical protein
MAKCGVRPSCGFNHKGQRVRVCSRHKAAKVQAVSGKPIKKADPKEDYHDQRKYYAKYRELSWIKKKAEEGSKSARAYLKRMEARKKAGKKAPGPQRGKLAVKPVAWNPEKGETKAKPKAAVKKHVSPRIKPKAVVKDKAPALKAAGKKVAPKPKPKAPAKAKKVPAKKAPAKAKPIPQQAPPPAPIPQQAPPPEA